MRTKGNVLDLVVGLVGVGTATSPKVELARTLEIDSVACGGSGVSPLAHERLDDCIAIHWAILTGAAVRLARILSEVPMGYEQLSSVYARLRDVRFEILLPKGTECCGRFEVVKDFRTTLCALVWNAKCEQADMVPRRVVIKQVRGT
jgi:hypothetical protein